jgi:hypothetical protein
MSVATPELEIDGTLYAFERGFRGEGLWVCRRGKCKGLIGHSNAGAIVPIIVSSELTTLAKEKGIAETFNFARNPPPPPKPEPRKRGEKKSASKTPSLKGGFNPFAVGK